MKRIHLILAIILAVLFIASLNTGASPLPLSQILTGLLGSGELNDIIVGEIRLPRSLLAMFIGFALGLSGAAMQGYLRNPLAEPGIFGVSAAASLGAVLVLQFGGAITANEIAGAHNISKALLVPVISILFAVIVSSFVAIFGAGRPERMLLIGIGVSSMAGALISLTLNLSPNPYAAYDIMFWLMGSVENRSMDHFLIMMPFFVLGLLMILSQARALDALALGSDTAQSLGINMRKLSIILVLGVSFLVGAGVAVAGAIGFVGLIVPHMLRPFIGNRPSQLLFAAGLAGAILLLGSDIAIQYITPIGRKLQLGVFTALIGTPIFVHMVIRGRMR